MNRQEAKDYVKAAMYEYLSGKGINTRKPFICLNPEHSERNASMSFDEKRQKVHCFSCGADYDVIDLIGIDYGLTDDKDKFNKAYEVFNLQVENDRTTAAEAFKQKPSGFTTDYSKIQNQPRSEQYTHSDIHTNAYTQEHSKPSIAASNADYTAYFKEAQSRIAQTDYPQKRGLSDEVIARFQLGYEPSYSKGTGGKVWQALIIPTSKGSYIARNTDAKAEQKDRYRKTGGSPLYLSKSLARATKPLFIVEGELDALSIITAGGEAMALGSTANSRSFIKLLEASKPSQPLIIALDNDQAGEKAATELIEEIKKLQLPFYRLNPYGEHKDANEALLADHEAFIAAVRAAEHIEDEAKEAEKEAYLKTSAGSNLQSFINGIASSVDTPYIPTGFSKFDEVLDGGLYEGLYIVGAISSLGKTTLITQIADQIAQRGTDILIFSLEMARAEIMAKSISRHTLEEVLANGGDIKNAKTTRGITTGKRYEKYNNTERELISTAINTYAEYAERIYISEGVGDIGAEQVKEAVKKHILFTGRKPVVVIDYLQILAPYSERATDKQNTDKAVMEMKRISRDYKIPVIGISSFNRTNYSVGVTMEAFKESGAIEYSSDVLIGLQLKGAGEKGFDATEEKKKNPREIELVILKNRNGRAGDKIPFNYYPLFNYFKEA